MVHHAVLWPHAAVCSVVLGALCTLPLAACGRDPPGQATLGANSAGAPEAGRDSPHPRVVPLRAPRESEIPEGRMGESIRRGHALLAATRDSLPAYVGNRLRCLSCHLDDGRRANASPLVGVYARYPNYNARSGHIYTIEDRINDCFRRSLNGHSLPPESAALRDITAYLAWLSSDVPVGAAVKGQGLPRLAPRTGDSARGRAIFAATCARCHGADGAGTKRAPPLWGAGSFNIGAGMARLRTAAAFIRHNMPFDRPGSLTDQQAFDVAAYITSRPRPDFVGKENDWPNGDAPPDVAYPTRSSRAASQTRAPREERAPPIREEGGAERPAQAPPRSPPPVREEGVP
jgi:thiosulfate dehydrogenase